MICLDQHVLLHTPENLRRQVTPFVFHDTDLDIGRLRSRYFCARICGSIPHSLHIGVLVWMTITNPYRRPYHIPQLEVFNFALPCEIFGGKGKEPTEDRNLPSLSI